MEPAVLDPAAVIAGLEVVQCISLLLALVQGVRCCRAIQAEAHDAVARRPVLAADNKHSQEGRGW
jgi:hypothetical protein